MSIGTYNPQVQPWDGTRRINPNDWNNLVYNVTGSQIKSGSFEVDGPVYISGSLVVSGSTNIGLSATVNVQNTGIIAGARGTINLLSGSGINLTVADSPNSRTIVTVASYGTSNPANVTVAASPSTGVSGQLARSDHIHGSPSTWTPSIHSSTHTAGGSDPVTGSLTLASLTTGNITGNI